MARRSISIDEKINQQKQVVFQAKDKYDAAEAELEKLMKSRDEVRQLLVDWLVPFQTGFPPVLFQALARRTVRHP